MTQPNTLRALIVGATGASGQLLTQRLLDDPRYSEVHILHYRTTSFSGRPKVCEHLLTLDDLSKFQISSDEDSPVDRVFCCLGTTLKQAGSVAAFARVDRDYVIELGRWVQRHKVAQFHVVSSLGVSARSPNYYSRTKGEMETALRNLNLPGLCIYRPSMLHARRNPPRLNERLSFPIVKALCLLPGLGRFQPLDVADLAAAIHLQSLDELSGIKEIQSVDMQGANNQEHLPSNNSGDGHR
ncbi:NAD-dependent epimerase/dehydratase family protein [Aestuariirhabdus sp. Z084]|uniref:NAD-dependent epimerase/dehydratase family protein n=1 Tax=Aestuariirhabdus haliotis TaxID=2918751 RepID=UPI00201B4386|nr:NAD-dependent epimerase/dehydratase family protein [Aestuariirhabdus haliotis]MCL6415291.1 NAD-dependent epimerase/dehydratase family protein [Aestuariirhabdus haliotis]MCL6419551.1 NAD-dependent epimerase/dehydratase family protein [Aestuariirhabdus haliotis]